MNKRLGKGLADIISAPMQSASNFVMLKTEQIRLGRFQPRTKITAAVLEGLKVSVKRQGGV